MVVQYQLEGRVSEQGWILGSLVTLRAASLTAEPTRQTLGCIEGALLKIVNIVYTRSGVPWKR